MPYRDHIRWRHFVDHVTEMTYRHHIHWRHFADHVTEMTYRHHIRRRHFVDDVSDPVLHLHHKLGGEDISREDEGGEQPTIYTESQPFKSGKYKTR